MGYYLDMPKPKMHLDSPTPGQILRFLAGPARREPEHRETFEDVWRTYLNFCHATDDPILGRSTFGYFLARQGITSVRGTRNKCYRQGIKILR